MRSVLTYELTPFTAFTLHIKKGRSKFTKNKEIMKYQKEQLEKLPKWAQTEIRSLENSVKYLEQQISELIGESESNTYLVEGLNKKPLINNAKIQFEIGHNNMNKVNVCVHPNGMINVNTDSRLGHTMVIMPRAANAFYISFL